MSKHYRKQHKETEDTEVADFDKQRGRKNKAERRKARKEKETSRRNYLEESIGHWT